jgi:hypothetical protein
MAVFHAPETAMAKELRKWEYGPQDQGYRGPREYQEYPKMLSLAGRNDAGQVVILEERVADDAVQERNLESRGFCFGRGVALEAFHENRAAEGVAAAERAYTDRRMSPKAQAEAAEADEAAGMRHVGAVPETPIKPKRKYTRRAKGA